jgi:hypothetical protein
LEVEVIDRDHQKVVKVVGPSSLNHSKCPTPHSISLPYSPKLDIYALKEDPVQATRVMGNKVIKFDKLPLFSN